MADPDPNLMAALALTRLGMGAGPGDLAAAGRGPRRWAERQIIDTGAPLPSGDLPDTEERLASYRRSNQQARNLMSEDGGVDPQARLDARRQVRRDLSGDTADAFRDRAILSATTGSGFAERWALFWSNALTVSSSRITSAMLMGQYEAEAIRPHVFGPFETLLLAAEQHPAMLMYLDQTRSTGPDSRAGQRRNTGLNENLAREILELHTLGADAGYAQADVTELARALTGWTVQGDGGGRRSGGNADQPGPNGFAFRPSLHQPGARRVLGKTYDQSGQAQGEAILRDLASHPRTGRRLARRIAAHFVADDPPAALVEALETAWVRSEGRLDAVARALIAAPETWAPGSDKIKTPYEFVVSAHRALGMGLTSAARLRSELTTLGQPPFSAPSPEGWPDTAADWAGPDALVKRLDWAEALAERAPGRAEPLEIAADALGARLSERTRLAVARAESRPEALTLFLMSPEFQRR